MKTMWNDRDRQEIDNRLLRLDPTASPRWGSMNCPQALAHLTDALKMALGDLPCTERRLPIRYPPLKQLIIYWLPFPKGAPTAPELMGRAPVTWGAELIELRTLVDRFAKEPPDRVWPDHPAFGRLSRQAWGVLVYRHMDHHLRQFGV